MTRGRAVAASAGIVIVGLATWLVGFAPATVSPPRPIAIPTSGYVALGDSYSAGEGLNPYLVGTQNVAFHGNRCHRSSGAYGAVLAGQPNARNFVFRACSGAVIAEVAMRDQRHGAISAGGPQIHGLSDAGLVTLTIGGNDALFATIVQFCGLQSHCLDSPKWRRDGAPNLRTWADTRLATIADDLRTLLEQLSVSLPHARIIVLGYPLLFSLHPTSGGQRSCLTYGLFSRDERIGLRQLGDRLNLHIAKTALATGHEYVHVADAFDGHETCGQKGQWLQFFRIDPENLTSKDMFDAGNFHPTADGQRMLARLVACYLETHPTNRVPAQIRHRADRATSLAQLAGTWPMGRATDAVMQCARR